MDTCDECGFEYDLDEARTAGKLIVDGVDDIIDLLGSDAEVGRRWDPDRWSPLEYGCHLRDVLLVQRERVLLARRVDCPSVVPMGVDERVEHDGYAGQDVTDVSRQLADAAQMFANVLARLGDESWSRTLIYNYPSPKERTLRWVAMHTAHEVRHHLLDVRRQLIEPDRRGPV